MTPRKDPRIVKPETRLGSAYGKDVIQPTPFSPPNFEPGPKVEGKDEIGSARKPPSIGPIMTPILKHIGNSRNARDWYLNIVS